MKKRMRLIIRGKVQGVFFRMHTEETALARGLTGWVRNNPDGAVETVFEGEAQQVADMAAWCQRGPNHARVDSVEKYEEKPLGEFNAFYIKYE